MLGVMGRGSGARQLFNSNPGLDRDVLVSVKSSALVLLVEAQRIYLPLTNIKRSVVRTKTIYYRIYLISSATN